MEIVVLKNVPGYTENRFLAAGTTADVSEGVAVSLINDGYAKAAVRAVAAESRETAAVEPKTRGRKAAS